jgi:hypothetical protein
MRVGGRIYGQSIKLIQEGMNEARFKYNYRKKEKKIKGKN